jgi:hypothetical protein
MISPYVGLLSFDDGMKGSEGFTRALCTNGDVRTLEFQQQHHVWADSAPRMSESNYVILFPFTLT